MLYEVNILVQKQVGGQDKIGLCCGITWSEIISGASEPLSLVNRATVDNQRLQTNSVSIVHESVATRSVSGRLTLVQLRIFKSFLVLENNAFDTHACTVPLMQVFVKKTKRQYGHFGRYQYNNKLVRDVTQSMPSAPLPRGTLTVTD